MVAHVADAEGLALEVAVAVGDLVAAVLEARHQVCHVEVARRDARDRGGGELGGGVELEAVARGPLDRAALHALVALEARPPGLGAGLVALALGQGHAIRDVLELLGEAEVLGRGRGRRRLALHVALEDLDRVEAPAPRVDRLGALHVALRGAEDRDARGHREGLLHARQAEVEAVGVEVHRGTGDVADEVDQQHRVAEVAHHARHRGQGRAHAGGGLVADEGDRVEGALFLEGAPQGVGRHPLAPGDLEGRDLLAEDLGHLAVAPAEGAVLHAQHPRAHAAQGGLHHPRGADRVGRHLGGGVLGQAEGQPQVRVEARDQVLHGLGAVADGGAGAGGQDLGTDFGGAGDPEHRSGGVRRCRRGGRPRSRGRVRTGRRARRARRS